MHAGRPSLPSSTSLSCTRPSPRSHAARHSRTPVPRIIWSHGRRSASSSGWPALILATLAAGCSASPSMNLMPRSRARFSPIVDLPLLSAYSFCIHSVDEFLVQKWIGEGERRKGWTQWSREIKRWMPASGRLTTRRGPAVSSSITITHHDNDEERLGGRVVCHVVLRGGSVKQQEKLRTMTLTEVWGADRPVQCLQLPRETGPIPGHPPPELGIT